MIESVFSSAGNIFDAVRKNTTGLKPDESSPGKQGSGDKKSGKNWAGILLSVAVPSPRGLMLDVVATGIGCASLHGYGPLPTTVATAFLGTALANRVCVLADRIIFSEWVPEQNARNVHRFDPDSGETLRDHVVSATADIHKQAHDSTFIKALLGLEVSKQDCALYIKVLYFLYHGLEDLAAAPVMPEDIRALVYAINRSDALSQSCQAPECIMSPDHTAFSEIPGLPIYLSYLESIALEPVKILAHLYVRYGGDMAGGQTIRRKIQKVMEHASAASFFDFGDHAARKQKRHQLHSLVNSISQKYPGSENDFVDESYTAFEHNIAISNDLGKFLSLSTRHESLPST